MYIAIGDAVTLEEADDFTRFHVSAGGGDLAAVVSALGAHASPADRDNHIWLDIAYLRALAGARATDEWEQQFTGMIGYAASQGWTDEPGERVQAHIDWRD